MTNDPSAALIREVWVAVRARHVPAHRIPDAKLGDPAEVVACPVACPPYIATGGHAITRREAHELQALPCRACFGIPHQDVQAARRQRR